MSDAPLQGGHGLNERAPPRRNVPALAVAGLALALLFGTTFPVSTADIPLNERRSAYDQMSAETKAMQDDDTSNPSTLWVLDGEALWHTKAGTAGRACVDCHAEAPQSMKGVAARYPAYDPHLVAPINLEGRINTCRTEQQRASALALEGRELLALTAYVARQSRGMPIESGDARLEPFIVTGRALFERRQGQLNLSCAHCHNDN